MSFNEENYTEDDKKYILNEFLDNIYGISNKEYQERVWIRAEGPECYSYESAVNDFFDNGDEFIMKYYKNFHITEKQYQSFIKLRDEFDNFHISHSSYPPDFINTAEWEKIMNLAKNVLDEFEYQHVPFEERVKETEALNKKRGQAS